MTDSSDSEQHAVVSDIVRFRDDLFFEGAVQLRWIAEDSVRATSAAANFVFHGPRYHAVRREDTRDGYVLRDTASFSADLVEDLAVGEKRERNPFSLAVAGYGSGKSHLAVTLAKLLSAPFSEPANKILNNVKAADRDEGERLSRALDGLHAPVLTVALDGMANFHLGTEISRSIIVKLREADCDLTAVEELSPRFTAAQEFVNRNFGLRSADFNEMLPDIDADTVITRLREHDEVTYSAVDAVFERANGAHIPVEGGESIQDLISTVTSVYCGENGPFSGLLILFDEFGRFLEYAAERPRLAGDSALQQLFQGVQDSADRARFLGFIQYDLKAYVSRLDRHDLMHLQRYITRFEAADKSYLSTNLETLFAHLIEKRDTEFVERVFAEGKEVPVIHHLLLEALPEAENLPVWREIDQFRRVICGGCWPLDPLAVWFLSQQQDVVQSRSALNIVKTAIDRVAQDSVLSGVGRTRTISAGDLLLTDMLPEFVAAEQTRGGVVAETLKAILDERSAQLEPDDRRVLAGAAVLSKVRVRLPDRVKYETLLGLAAGLSRESLSQALGRLDEHLGVLSWNDDYGQYELVQDAATRGQFTLLLRKRALDPAAQEIGPLFIAYARPLCNLQAVDPGFANSNDITTHDWHFESIFADADTACDGISRAFKDWHQAADVNEAKGRIVYTYVGASEDIDYVRGEVRAAFAAELRQYSADRAPILVVLMHDTDERIAESLRRYWVLQRGLTDEEKERYQRFVSSETDQIESVAQEASVNALSHRLHEVAGFEEAPNGRLSQVGHEVFARVYPQVVSFPFDGFATGSGSGITAKKDCLDIVRALVNGEADAEWIQSRVSRLRNRASHLLAKSWKVLGSDGALAMKPSNPCIATTLSTLDDWHQAMPECTLEQTRRALIAPPFGCNVASAALVLGLFLARRRPRRRLVIGGDVVQASEWSAQAFKATDLDHKVLARTTVRFLAEDAEAQWESLLEEWRNATRHQQRIGYSQTAKDLQREGPVPEEYLYEYERLADQARQARETVQAFERKFDRIQRDLERLMSQGATSLSALAVCDQLLDLQQEVRGGAWEENTIDEMERVVLEVRNWVEEKAPQWIGRANCRSPQEVTEYRHKMEKAYATCRRLGLSHLADQIEQHRNHSIATVEERFRYQSTLVEARQFASTTTISAVAPISEIEGIKRKTDMLISVLREAHEQLQDEEVGEVIDLLEQRRLEADQAITKHRDDLQSLYSAPIDSLDAARALKSKVARAQEVFVGQRDLADIEDARKQLEKVCSDLEAWNGIEGSPEDVESQLAPAIEERCKELDRWCDEEEVEPLWTFQEVYTAFCERKVNEARERSALWARSIVPSTEDINNLSLERCRRKLRELEQDVPVHLGKPEREMVDRACEALHCRTEELLERYEREEAQRWLANLDGVAEGEEQLSRAECERLLRFLRMPPARLNSYEVEFVEDLTLKVERQLDVLDVSDIIDRIRRLDPNSFAKVVKAIKELSNGDT